MRVWSGFHSARAPGGRNGGVAQRPGRRPNVSCGPNPDLSAAPVTTKATKNTANPAPRVFNTSCRSSRCGGDTSLFLEERRSRTNPVLVVRSALPRFSGRCWSRPAPRTCRNLDPGVSLTKMGSMSRDACSAMTEVQSPLTAGPGPGAAGPFSGPNPGHRRSWPGNARRAAWNRHDVRTCPLAASSQHVLSRVVPCFRPLQNQPTTSSAASWVCAQERWWPIATPKSPRASFRPGDTSGRAGSLASIRRGPAEPGPGSAGHGLAEPRHEWAWPGRDGGPVSPLPSPPLNP